MSSDGPRLALLAAAHRSPPTTPRYAWSTIPAMLADTAQQLGTQAAIVDEQGSISYAELHERARAFAAAVVAAGIDTGDRIAIWAGNSAEWIVSALGAWHAGCAVVPINTRFKGREAAEILARTSAKVLITTTDFLEVDYVEMLRSSGLALPALATIVVASGSAPSATTTWREFLSCTDESHLTEADRRAKGVTGDDVSDILFTSGTTGAPKGVVQTHARTLHVGCDFAEQISLTAGDRYLMVNPYFHMFGMKAGILTAVSVGATMYPQAVFDPEQVLERIATHRITALPGPPTLFQSLLDHPSRRDFDLSTLRVSSTGAADIPVELIRRIREELSFEVMATGYGLTEAGTVSSTRASDDPETIAKTVGRPRPGFEYLVVDAHGLDVGAETSGEIYVRGPSVMAGYLEDPEATAEVLTPDGWLRTGDLGCIDAAGNLTIVGRAKDMFIVGGFNAYPAEIENLMLEHPDVAQVAVIGVPDERLGEVGKAFVVPRVARAGLEATLVAWCRERMANYKAPRSVELIDALPVNPTGKVVKDELRARAAASRAGNDGGV